MRLDELFKSDDDNKTYKKIVGMVHTDKGGDLDDIQSLNHARDVNDVAVLRRLEKKYLYSATEKPKKPQSKINTNYLNELTNIIVEYIDEYGDEVRHMDYQIDCSSGIMDSINIIVYINRKKIDTININYMDLDHPDLLEEMEYIATDIMDILLQHKPKIGGSPISYISSWCGYIEKDINKGRNRINLTALESEGIPVVSIRYTANRIFRGEKAIIATVNNAHTYKTRKELEAAIMSAIDKKL